MKYAIYYNYRTIGDDLIIVFDSEAHPDEIKKNDDVVALYKNGKIVGINILNFSEIMKLKVDGFIPIINEKMLKIINNALVNAGFEPLEEQKESGFRVAKIIECEEHPESEHLHVLKVDVGNNEFLDIVCGAFNARVGLKCVCALPYTFMPNGQQIIPSKLLGIQSNGMLCSGRELVLPGYEGKHGLLELDDNSIVGSDFFKEM
jgi:tRNA-binding protein